MKKPKKSTNPPRDELTLARLIQVTKARGLRACRGAEFRDLKGQACGPEDAVACCAFGAAEFARLTLECTVVEGNDDKAYPFVDYPLRFMSHYDIGRCFYDACKR